MKSTRLTVTQKNIYDFKGDLLVFCALKREKQVPLCDDEIMAMVTHVHELGDFSGKENQTLLYYPEQSKITPEFSARRVLVVGLGGEKDLADEFAVREALRKAGGTIAKTAGKIKAQSIMVRTSDLEICSLETMGECLAEGLVLGDYRFDKYQKEKPDEEAYKGIKDIKFFSDQFMNDLKKGVKKGGIAARAACSARNMANEPGNGWTASDFATHAGELAERFQFKLSVLNTADMKQMGMGGLLAVNQGSIEPPKMVILEYHPPGKHETLLLVGKGITFDSGGVSLKPGPGMEEMKYDMCGGAAVLAAMEAVGREKPKLGVVAIIPATDNMAGGGAVKPGDIIRHYDGTSSEIVNTDAEGRMILADALAYGIKTFEPTCVVDIATLTGAAIMGLGHHYTSLLSNNDALVQCLEIAGKRTGEPMWRLPLGKEYTKQIESKVADIKNVGGKAAGTITAAAYLEHFVGKTPWAHLDIAGTAWNFTEKTYIPKGPSGMGARTFIDVIRNWKKGTVGA
ncbi:leucyl aminopeptidase [Desulfocicer vacuolatum DSM 3385]|uniref:Probable cytosol aminopeptidase n=1 Tax=Desulfocicer vacuolatum DSM 3385 TaxID=1121400 RepID=A0A1W2ARY4_9BACT|nr:leucyl aminopeptidase [Desulfocicer vacuolatum]SMC63477.1 leucyl aminopeptidase [Desulfocicer vacuolatum DSM 3385]